MQHPITCCSQSVSKSKAKVSHKLEDVRLMVFPIIQRIKGFCKHTDSCLLILSVICRLEALRTGDIGLSNAYLFYWKIINNCVTDKFPVSNYLFHYSFLLCMTECLEASTNQFYLSDSLMMQPVLPEAVYVHTESISSKKIIESYYKNYSIDIS